MTFGLKSLLIFGKFSDFCCITPETDRRGQGAQFPGRRITAGNQKVTTMTQVLFQNSTFASKRPQVRTWGAKLVSFPRRDLTSLPPCTSRLSSQNGEISLQTYLPISYKLSITNYLKQNAVDYRSHLTVENNFKVEKKVYYFENRHNFSSPAKKCMGYA